MQSHIDDKDIQNILDLETFYPAPDGFAYFERGGDFFARRKSDLSLYPILVEADMLTFDVPNDSGGKFTFEVEKRF